jgi:hypothetical protein
MKKSLICHFLIGSLLVWTVMITAGCTKHKPADAANNPVPAAVSVSPDSDTANPAVKPNVAPVVIAPAGVDPGPMLAQLTQVLRRFSVEHRQVPKSLDDLVAAGYLAALPAAPAGKQFVIDPKQMVVVLR